LGLLVARFITVPSRDADAIEQKKQTL